MPVEDQHPRVGAQGREHGLAQEPPPLNVGGNARGGCEGGHDASFDLVGVLAEGGEGVGGAAGDNCGDLAPRVTGRRSPPLHVAPSTDRVTVIRGE
jgi:hypothetical protein